MAQPRGRVSGAPRSPEDLVKLPLVASLALLVACLWGLNFIAIHVSLEQFPPFFTVALRWLPLGVAVSIAGMAADSAFKTERLAAIQVGQNVTIGPFRVTLADVHPTVGPNWSALEARLQIRRGDGKMFELFPQQRFFSTPPTNTPMIRAQKPTPMS